MRRISFTTCTFALMCFLLAGSVNVATGADPVTVRIGVPAVYPIYSIFLAAKELGYYQDQGLNVEILTFRGGPASQEALVAGAIELCSQPPRAVALAVDKGVKEHIVALYAPPRPAGWYIMVPTASPIKSAADLNGKTVGVTQIGSLTDLWVQVAAKAAGITVTNVPLGGGVLAGIRAKQVDAGILSAPQSYKALASGDLRVAADLEPLLPPSVSEGVTASDAFIEQKPDALRRWLAATSKALVYMQTHESWSVAFIRRYDDDNDDRAATLTFKNFIMKINPDGAMRPAWMKAALELGNTDAANMAPERVFSTAFTPLKNFR